MIRRFLRHRVLIGSLISLVVLTVAQATPAKSSAIDTSRTIVDNYRKIIVLFIDEHELSERQLERATSVGRIIYHQNREQLTWLKNGLLQGYLRPESSSPVNATAFLDWIENDPQLWDADKLVFKGMMESLVAELQRGKPGTTWQRILLKRIRDDARGLAIIQKRYDKEIDRIFGRFSGRAIENRRQSWNKYLGHVRTLANREAILEQYDPEDNLVPTRRSVKPVSHEISGNRFKPGTVALTFDDGPHGAYTDKILKILKAHGVGATFFQVGKNVGEVEKNTISFTAEAEVSRRVMRSGHLLANHSYTHPVLPKLPLEDVEKEIRQTNQVLEGITETGTELFRAPYGARNDQILALLKDLQMKSVIWNVDSRDWADPVPRSVARRVLEQIDKRKRGIILFHDVQASTVEALPYVLDSLVARGYRFAGWDGKNFTPEPVAASPSEKATPARLSLYNRNWAVIIGINRYRNWPKLKYAANDARSMHDLLINELGFQPERIITLYDEQATREGIMSAFMDKLGDPDKVKKQDSVFVFYAGHGATRSLPTGRDLGYIIPVDAKAEKYYSSSISMTNFQDITEVISAKHIFFIMDSCYSGLALTRGAGRGSRNFLEENSRRIGRQIMTAGGADQQVTDNGPNGHSIFTWTLLQGLKGQGDLNKDGFITASELSAYLSPIVSSVSLQTPVFGNMPGSEGGDYVFALKEEKNFLSESSEIASDQEIALNRKLAQLEEEITEKREKNLRLKKELAQVRALIQDKERGEARSNHYDRTRSIELNDKGLDHYRGKDLGRALDYFTQAANTDPSYSEATNNVGFVLFRLKRFQEAVTWLEKTTMLDPKRAVAWLNLANGYAELGQKEKARNAYQVYLKIFPNSPVKATILDKLSALN